MTEQAKARAMIPGTVPCDVPKGHVTAGLSPVLWRSGISERFVTRLHLVTFVMQKDRGQNNANAKTVQRLAERESNQVGFDVQIFPIPAAFLLEIPPVYPARKAIGLGKICCVKTARTRRRMHF